jgi:hypothetical protein
MSRSTPTVKSARPHVQRTRAFSVSTQRSTLSLLVLGAVVSAVVSGTLVNIVSAAVWQGPPAGVPPANNRPFIIWNSEDSGIQQTSASLNIDGMAVVGNATEVLAPAENLIYGNISGTSTGNLLLLQVDSLNVLRVTKDGDATFKGDVKSDACLGGTFVGLSTATSNGNAGSYYAANTVCNAQYAGSHVCRAEEVLESISCGATGDPIKNVANNGLSGWVIGGPPGFNASANDCIGWTSALNSATIKGRIWTFNAATGGTGWLSFCDSARPFACCK